MGKRIVVNAGLTETRVAVQENSQLVELYHERHRQRSIVGSVYKGIVTNVLPGMQAAFVDIGLTKDAFLYAGDYTASLGEDVRAVLAEEEPNGEADAEADVDVDEEPKREATAPIAEMLRKGQTVLVQVSKESLGTKGARITAFISLPGRYLVYMPQTTHIGVSRRIKDDRERDRLRQAIRALNPPPGGYIVRTNAEGKGAEEFAADIAFLQRLWSQINTRNESTGAPAALHEEMDLTFRVVRDLLSPEVDEFIVDSREVYDKCLGDAQVLVPALAERIKLYEGPTPIFEAHGLEREIEKALRRRVWLKSGGYIVIDHTEALVSIDVNTGKYVGKRDFEQTVLKINLEAATEVVRQIRLRDLGGIIIIDFIDMEREEHRAEVEKALKKALADDKARTNVLPISELGLVEMTRKRVRQDLRAALSAGCPTCRGSGVVRSDATLTAEILRSVQSKVAAQPGKDVLVRAHPELVQYLENDGRDALARLGTSLGVKVGVQTAGGHPHREDYEIHLR
ncbi:MAG: Rne/Rng family ribonuclease [Candidatus Rokubacteria bacterium]|nr:Rne/Rng family ribonuclease [Candidatus Rokubacteria bacterium]